MRIAEIDRPGEIGDVDIVVLAVKNYSLEAVARQVRDELGDRPIIVSLANGIDNQRILPKFFSKVIYGVVGYNARRDAPVVVGYQRQGAVADRHPDNTLIDELRLVQSILARGCPTEIVDRLQDAVHTKIVINLTNALDALVGRGWRPLSNLAGLSAAAVADAVGGRAHRARRRLTASTASPAFRRLPSCGRSTLLPGWMHAAACSRRKLRAMPMSSMTQDVALRGAPTPSLNRSPATSSVLPPKHGVPAPYNRAIYRLGRKIPPRIRAATMRGGVGSSRARTQFAPGRRA